MLVVDVIPTLKDNYSYVVRKSDSNDVIVIDPGEADPVIKHCKDHNLKPRHVLNTHHHWDHVNGNQGVVDCFGAQLFGPATEADRINGVDQALSAGDVISLLDSKVEVTEVSGHTSGHLVFYFSDEGLLFSGDVLFAMGCGRLFEGTAEQMFEGFQYFRSLPDETKVYCGHEYTLDNGRFCMSVFPENEEIKSRVVHVERQRQKGQVTIPTTIGQEKRTNAFMMAKTAKEFAVLRAQKDEF